MSQYRQGTIAISSTVTPTRAIGSANADWSTLPNPATTTTILTLTGTVLWYEVTAIKAPGSVGNTTSDRWEMLINAPFVNTNAVQQYQLTYDFEAAFGFPLFNAGDLQTDVLFNRFILMLVAILQSGNLGGGGGVASLGANAQVNAGSNKLAVLDPEEGFYHDLIVLGGASGAPALAVAVTGEPANP